MRLALNIVLTLTTLLACTFIGAALFPPENVAKQIGYSLFLIGAGMFLNICWSSP